MNWVYYEFFLFLLIFKEYLIRPSSSDQNSACSTLKSFGEVRIYGGFSNHRDRIPFFQILKILAKFYLSLSSHTFYTHHKLFRNSLFKKVSNSSLRQRS